MVFETVYFGEQVYDYLILVLILGSSTFLVGLFWRWFRRLFIPSKRLLKKSNRALLFLLISWPLLIVGGGFWGAYQIGYRHFYSLRICSKKEILVQYLWPKGDVNIHWSELSSVSVVRKGLGSKASDILMITTKSGRIFLSTAPVPNPESLPGKILESVGLKKSN